MSTPNPPTGSAFSLNDKYLLEKGSIILSGIQALIRLPIDQHRADQRQGLNTATFISGYRGSPLGGIDISLLRMPEMLKQFQINFTAAVNEDLGATAVFGSQFANFYPDAKYEGVLGMWYGKGPGVDRSGDIFKHANFAGTGRNGGVLAICGDDPTAKSSTIPHQSEYALMDAYMPVLYPGSVQDIIDMGLYGFALSRYCGLWVGFKIVTDVADSFATATVSPDRVSINIPKYEYEGKIWQHQASPNLLTPYSLGLEKTLVYPRTEAVRQFAAVNPLNKIWVNPTQAWLGLISAGKNYYDLRHTLNQLGLDDEALRARGIRILKLGMSYPLEPHIIKQFSKGLEEIWVIEEKRPFIEDQLKALIYHLPDRPMVIGKQDEYGKGFVPRDAELDADRLLPILYKRLKQKLPKDILGERHELLLQLAQKPVERFSVMRRPHYCSGCPHNISTLQVPEGSSVGGGIGCHGMAIRLSHTEGITQMGGEGAQWVGMAPFTHRAHLFQNIGDGTFFHSGSLAIRQAISAGTNVTYKLLYNAAVGMTGGQHADGSIPVPELTRLLAAEGVKYIIVTTDQPNKYPGQAQWADSSMMEIWHRDKIIEAQEKLRDIAGVTVLIHDQECAAELRRMRRRGKVAEPPMRVFINEAVCEGCGDCGRKSNCLSVVPVETEFGRKTQIHQASCNKDYSCLKGDCPAFVSVIPEVMAQKQRKALSQIRADLPAPDSVDSAHIYMVGIGGTGVVTVNQILGTAAMLEGKVVKALDQTGLSQKGGSVTSHLKIYAQHLETSSKVAVGEADTYIAFDILAATMPKNLKHAQAGKTIAIVSTSKVATGEMVTNTQANFPQLEKLQQTIDAQTRKQVNVYLDAQSLSEQLFGSHIQANMLLIGTAFQSACLPLSAESIEQAIRLNGVSVEKNIQAFRVGRKAVLDPEWAERLQQPQQSVVKLQPETLEKLSGTLNFQGLDQASEILRHLIGIRISELIAYQNRAYAQTYVDFVAKVWKKEQAFSADNSSIAEAVARYLFKLMAYKDEYEVARLHLKPSTNRMLEATFGKGAKVSYWLHPPILRAMGWQKKMTLGAWFQPGLKLLRWMKFLRGTVFDLFGYAAVRKTEVRLISEYKSLIEDALDRLEELNYEHIVALAEAPDIIRGYEEVKMENVASYRMQVALLQQKIKRGERSDLLFLQK